MKKIKDNYKNSSVSVPIEEKDKYKVLSIKDNTTYLDFILKYLTNNSDTLQKKDINTTIINFKYDKTHIKVYKDIQNILKKYNLNFSYIYKKLFDDFIKSK